MHNPHHTQPVEHHGLVAPCRIVVLERVRIDVRRLGELGGLCDVGFEGRGNQPGDVRIPGDRGVLQDGLRFHREADRRRDGGIARVHCAGIESRDDVGVDLAVDHAHRGRLHDRPLIALAREHVEARLADEIVPLDQGAGILVQVVRARRDETVDAARDCRRTAGIRHQEHCRVSFDDRFVGDGIAQDRLLLLKASDELLPVLGLKSRV